MSVLFSNQFPDQPQYLPRFGMTVRIQLGIQQLTIYSHFKPPAIRRNEHDHLDQVFITFQQIIHQAHGSTGVVSNRAINDLDLQHFSSNGTQKPVV